MIRSMNPDDYRESLRGGTLRQLFFNELKAEKGQLRNTHIDECLRGFVQMQHLCKYAFKVVAFANTDFSLFLTRTAFNDGNLNLENVFPYILGKFAEWPSFSWLKAKVIVFPLKIEQRHWVLCFASPATKTIVVLDSDTKSDEDLRKTKEALGDAPLIIPYLLKKIGVKDCGEQFSIKRDRNILQQLNSGDGGIHVLRNAFASFLRNDKLHRILPSHIIEFKKYLTASVFFQYWHWPPQNED